MSILIFIAKWMWAVLIGLFALIMYVGEVGENTILLWSKELKETGEIVYLDKKVTRKEAEDNLFGFVMTHLFFVALCSFLFWLLY